MTKEYIEREEALSAIKQAFEKGERPLLYIKCIPPPMLRKYGMGSGFNHIGKTVTIAVTVRSAVERQCTQITSGIKMASILYAHTVEQRWTGGEYENH